jgi:phosphoglycolate phosphatase-like HAD superfamily hydrolase
MAELVALDFDGVISDSAPESFLVSIRTWCETMPSTALARRAGAGRADPIPPAGQVTSDALYAGFLERMPLGNRAEDYGVVLASLDRGVDLPDQSAYDAFRAGFEASWLEAWHRRFYEIRHALADADPDGWLALMGPYPGLPELLRRKASEVVLAIATSKDARSVRSLLRAYGLDDVFDDDRLLDKETGVDKVAHLRVLHGRFGVAFADMVFVDDKVNHLDRVAPLGVRCVLAAWGYNGPREHALARQRGYGVVALADVEEALF